MGGVPPAEDKTLMNYAGSDPTKLVSFATKGIYPYYCVAHNSMQGVVYVGITDVRNAKLLISKHNTCLMHFLTFFLILHRLTAQARVPYWGPRSF